MLEIRIESSTAMAIKEASKSAVMGALEIVLDDLFVEYIGNTAYIPVEVNGRKVWVEMTLTTKQWTDTKIAPAFDIKVEQENYRINQEAKEREAEEKRKAKEEAARLKKSKSRSRKASEEVTEEN